MLKQGKEAKNDPKSFLAHGEKIRAAFHKVANKAGFINQQISLDLISNISNLLPKLQNDPQAIISLENQKVADLYDLTKISYVDFLELINLVIFKEEDSSPQASPPDSQRIPPIDGNDSARRKLPARNTNVKNNNKEKEETSSKKPSSSPSKRGNSIANSRNSPLPSQKNSNQPSPKNVEPIINPSDEMLAPKNEIDKVENLKEIEVSESEKKSVNEEIRENKGGKPQLYIPIGTPAGVTIGGGEGSPVNNSVNHGKSYQGSGGGSQRSVYGNDFPEGYEKNWENLSNLLSEYRNVFLERFGKYKNKGTEKISLEKYPEYLKICVEEIGLMTLKESEFEKKSIFGSSDPFKILEGVVGAYLYGRKKRSAKVPEKIKLTFLECFKVLKYWFKVDADIILIDDYYEERKKRLAVRDHIIAMIHKYEKMKQESKEPVEKKAFQTTLDALYKRFFEDYPGHSITEKPDDLDAVDQEAGGTETKEKSLFKKLEEKLTEQSQTKTVPTEQSQQKAKDMSPTKAKPAVVKENSKQKLSPQKSGGSPKDTNSESPQKSTAAVASKENNKSGSPRKTSLPKETKSESPQKTTGVASKENPKSDSPKKNNSPVKTSISKDKSPKSPKKEPAKQPESEELSKDAMMLLENTLGAVLKHEKQEKEQEEQEEEVNKETTMTPSENPLETVKKSKEEEDPSLFQIPQIRGSFEVSATPLQGSPKVTIKQTSSGFNSQKETIISNKEKDTIVLKETPMTKQENSSPHFQDQPQIQIQSQGQRENKNSPIVEKINETELKIQVSNGDHKKEENVIASPRRESPKQLTFGGNGSEDKIIMSSPKELPKELSQLSFSPNQAHLIETIQVSQMNLPSPKERIETQDERSVTPERIREELKFSKPKNEQRHSIGTDTLTTTIEKGGIMSEARRVKILKQIFDYYSKKIAGSNKVGYKSFEEIEKDKEGITLDIMSSLLKDFKIKVDAAKLRDKFKKEKKQDNTKLTFEEFDSFMKKLIVDAEIVIEQKPKQQADAAALRQRYRPSSYKSDPPVIKRSESPPTQKGNADLSDNEETRKIKDDEFWSYISEKYKEVLGFVKGDREQTASYESEKKSNSIRRSVDAEKIKHLYASIPDQKREVSMIKEAREDTRLSTQQEKSIKGHDINESLVKDRSSKKSLNRSVSITGGDSLKDFGSTDEVRRSQSNNKKPRESQEKPRKREVSSKGKSRDSNETARIMDMSVEKGRFPKEMLNESLNKRQSESLDSGDDIPLRKSIEKSPVIRAKVQRSPEKVVHRSKPEPQRRLHETFNPEDLFDKNDSEDDIYLAQYEVKKARKANSDNTHNNRNLDEKSRLLGALKLPRDMRKYRHIHEHKMVRRGTEKNLHDDATHATSERNNTPPSQRGENVSGSKEITFGVDQRRATGIHQKTINEIKLLNNRGGAGQSFSQSPSPPNRSSLDISMSNHNTQKGQMYHIPQVYNHMPPYGSHNPHDLIYSPPGKQAKASPRGFHSSIEHAGAGGGGSNRASLGGGNYSNITPPPYMNNLYPSWYPPVMHHPSMNQSGIYQGVNSSLGSGMMSGVYPGGNLQQGGVGGLNRNPNIQQGQQSIRAYPPGPNMQNPHNNMPHNMQNFQQQSMDMGPNLGGKNAQLRRISQHGGNPEMYQQQQQQPYYPLVMQQSNGQPLLMPMEQRRMSNKRSISNNARGRVSEVEEYLNQREVGAMNYMLNIEKLMRMKGQRAAWK